MPGKKQQVPLPTSKQIRRAIDIYLSQAYPDHVPQRVEQFLPKGEFEPADFLMSDCVERTPADAALADVRSFALRLGNSLYRHMKLRITRPPSQSVYLFCVDSHDAFLTAPPRSPEQEALDAIKRHNASLAAAVRAAWDQARLPTERSFLRKKIKEARAGRK